MREKANTGIRIILGLLLVVFGVNKFAQFMPLPLMPDAAFNFIKSLLETGYMMPVVGVIEVGVGLMLLANRYVALALVFLAPIAVNIMLFHLALDFRGIAGGLVVFSAMIYLMYLNKDKYHALLQA